MEDITSKSPGEQLYDTSYVGHCGRVHLFRKQRAGHARSIACAPDQTCFTRPDIDHSSYFYALCRYMSVAMHEVIGLLPIVQIMHPTAKQMSA